MSAVSPRKALYSLNYVSSESFLPQDSLSVPIPCALEEIVLKSYSATTVGVLKVKMNLYLHESPSRVLPALWSLQCTACLLLLNVQFTLRTSYLKV